MSWDQQRMILYIGGIFDSLGNVPITSSLCEWTKESGIRPFGGGSISNSPIGSVFSQAVTVIFDSLSEV